MQRENEEGREKKKRKAKRDREMEMEAGGNVQGRDILISALTVEQPLLSQKDLTSNRCSVLFLVILPLIRITIK